MSADAVAAKNASKLTTPGDHGKPAADGDEYLESKGTSLGDPTAVARRNAADAEKVREHAKPAAADDEYLNSQKESDEAIAREEARMMAAMMGKKK